MLTRSLFCAVALFGLLACEAPKSMPARKVLPAERWNSAQKGRITTYPSLARLAGISGDLVMNLDVNEQGQVTGVRLVSGPPQLASTVESFARSIRFAPQPADLPGPWAFSITARFDLAGKAGWAPTGQPISLQPVATPDPSLRGMTR